MAFRKSKPLPPFRYRCVSRGIGKLRKTATVTHRGEKTIPRCCFDYILADPEWKASNAPPPANWPFHLKWPQDVLKAAIYETYSNHSSRRGKTLVSETCSGVTCRNSDPGYSSSLCNCTIPAWDEVNTSAWMNREVDLRWRDADFGICAIAKNAHNVGEVLGEYFGEIRPIPDDDAADQMNNRYFMTVPFMGEVVAYVDAARLGSWTRFINHSCTPNVEYVNLRVGGEARIAIQVTRSIAAGEEIKADYGEEYWGSLADVGVFCRCGEDCVYGVKAGVGERKRGRVVECDSKSRKRLRIS